MDVRGQFRETLWFKRGELDDESTPAPLPVEDAYLDDGTVSPADSLRYGLYAAAPTQRLDLIKPPPTANEPELGALVRELGAHRRGALFAIALTLVLALVMTFAST